MGICRGWMQLLDMSKGRKVKVKIDKRTVPVIIIDSGDSEVDDVQIAEI